MRVILLKAVPKVGKPEEIVEVNEGFARNALFPKKLAIPANDTALAELKRKQTGRAAEKAVRKTLLDKAIESLQGKSLVYTARANDKGNLFSKIDAKDVASFLLNEHRLSIDPSCIMIPNDAIKTIGSYVLNIKDGAYDTVLNIEVVKK